MLGVANYRLHNLEISKSITHKKSLISISLKWMSQKIKVIWFNTPYVLINSFTLILIHIDGTHSICLPFLTDGNYHILSFMIEIKLTKLTGSTSFTPKIIQSVGNLMLMVLQNSILTLIKHSWLHLLSTSHRRKVRIFGIIPEWFSNLSLLEIPSQNILRYSFHVWFWVFS